MKFKRLLFCSYLPNVSGRWLSMSNDLNCCQVQNEKKRRLNSVILLWQLNYPLQIRISCTNTKHSRSHDKHNFSLERLKKYKKIVHFFHLLKPKKLQFIAILSTFLINQFSIGLKFLNCQTKQKHIDFRIMQSLML